MELKLRWHVVYLMLVGLLIVPYGIETAFIKRLRRNLDKLLIVPYGIETDKAQQDLHGNYPFNRTLWN